jgi:hypothetical protein
MATVAYIDTPLRRDLTQRLTDLRKRGPKNPHCLGLSNELRSLLTEVRELHELRESGASIEILSPTLAEVIAAGGYKVK